MYLHLATLKLCYYISLSMFLFCIVFVQKCSMHIRYFGKYLNYNKNPAVLNIIEGVSSLFRQVYIPTGRYSDRSIFRQVVIPTGLYSDSSIFRQVVIPTGLYSDRSIFRQVVIPTGLYSDRSILRQVYIPTSR